MCTYKHSLKGGVAITISSVLKKYIKYVVMQSEQISGFSMSANKTNALLFVAMIVIAAAPQTIGWMIDKYNDSKSTYVGMITCSDGKTMTGTSVHSDRPVPEYVFDADGNKLPCGKGAIFIQE